MFAARIANPKSTSSHGSSVALQRPRQAVIKPHPPLTQKIDHQAQNGSNTQTQTACACGGGCSKCQVEARSPASGGYDTGGASVVPNSAPEAPTYQAEGVKTETQGPAPAPGVFPPSPPPPTPAPSASADHCRTTGSFSSIPSGVLAATMTGSKLGTTFDMIADFDAAAPCNCSRGEYRQSVRGSFTANGSPVTHHIGPGLTLHPTRFQLDGNATTANYFGRRNYRTTYSHFEPDQAGGCQFQGQDIPGISAASGTALTVDLDFQGVLIDTGDSNRQLASASWSVRGSDTVP